MATNREDSYTNSETALILDLGKKKKVTVHQFNGVKLVDIREFYEDKKTGVLKPGLKGISLNEQAWNQLLESQEEISAALAQLGKNGADPNASKSKAQTTRFNEA